MKHKGVVYRKMIASFLMMLVIPVLLSVVFFCYSRYILRYQLEQINHNTLASVCSISDREILKYRAILRQYSRHEMVRDFGMQERLNGTDYLELKDLNGEMKTSLLTGSSDKNVAKDLIIYFPQMGQMISTELGGMVTIDSYWEQIHAADAEQTTQLEAKLAQKHKFKTDWVLLEDSTQPAILLSQSAWFSKEEVQATVGVLIPQQVLTNCVASVEWDHGFDWMILDESGRVVKGAKDMTSLGMNINLEDYAEEEDYLIYTEVSETTGWTYVLLTPRKYTEKVESDLRWFFFGSLVLCVFLGGLVTKRMVKRNYAPLEELIAGIRGKTNEVSKEDEYQFLQEQISLLLNTQSAMKDSLKKNRRTIQKMTLADMLTNPFADKNKNQESDSVVQKFNSGKNMVLILKIIEEDNEANLFPKNNGIKQFIVDNVFTEKISEIMFCEMLEFKDRQVLIVNSEFTNDDEERMWQKIYYLQEFLQKNFCFSVSVASGNQHEGAVGIYESYMEAWEAEDFLSLLDQRAITYREIQDKASHKYDYSTQTEEHIILAVLNNNVELATSIIEKVIDRNLVSNHAGGNIRRYLINDIYCTLLKVADEKGCIERVESSRMFWREGHAIQKVKDAFAQIVKSICTEDSSESSSDWKFCQRITQHVADNYSDPNLNISQLAMLFKMSPSALSSIYKREMGKSLLNVINEIRVERATEFIKEGYSVHEAATMVGISESSSFIRLFKKYVGVTPGKMKSIIQEKG